MRVNPRGCVYRTFIVAWRTVQVLVVIMDCFIGATIGLCVHFCRSLLDNDREGKNYRRLFRMLIYSTGNEIIACNF